MLVEEIGDESRIQSWPAARYRRGVSQRQIGGVWANTHVPCTAWQHLGMGRSPEWPGKEVLS